MNARWLAFAALAVVGCDQVYDVTLDISDAAAVRGFGCQNDAGFLLQERLTGKQVYIVVDVIDVGTEILSCRTTTIVDWCTSHPCKVIARKSTPIAVSGASPDGALEQAFQQLRAGDGGLSDLPTDRTVLVRFVATSEQNSDPTTTLDGTQAGGCVYSCPVRLDATGTLDLDLDYPPFAPCQSAVEACTTFPTL